MIHDAYEVPEDAVLDADLCIVGGGMVGLAIAREFRERPLRIVVLEGGGEQPEEESQALYRGAARIDDGLGGTVELGDFLSESRLRCLGGSGNIWGAKCALLDEADFEKREWVEGSGWPFSRDELRPYYDRACDILRIRRFDYDPEGEFDPGRPPLVVRGGERFTTATRHLSPVHGGPEGTELAEYKRAATEAENVDVYVHANAVEIETDASGRSARAVRVATLRGNRFRVGARAIVLAAGGIENARLLLLSRSTAKKGLGNEHDVVGRYFANHAIFGPGSAIGFTQETGSLDLYTTRDPRRVWGVLALDRSAQERERQPNFTVTMAPAEGGPDGADLDVVAASGLADTDYSPERGEPSTPVPVYFMSEQAPNPESRVTLSEEKDALGLPRVALDWRFQERDVEALVRSVRLFARELGREALGRVRCEWPAQSPVQEYSPSRHHIGTTRMHPDPRQGVVDANARVHGVENLYIAGSSIFPTSGIANPTLTIVALALRLADHLDGILRR